MFAKNHEINIFASNKRVYYTFVIISSIFVTSSTKTFKTSVFESSANNNLPTAVM